MHTAAQRPAAGRETPTAIALLGIAVLLLGAQAVRGSSPLPGLVLVALAYAVAAHRTLLQWKFLMSVLVLVILFVPIRRYSMFNGLPLQLEPYRILLGFMGATWLSSLLVDGRTRIRPSGFRGPLIFIVGATLASDVVNIQRIHELGVSTDVLKSVMFFLSYFLVLLLVVNLVRTPDEIVFFLRMLVGAGAVVAALVIVEWWTQFNVFDHLSKVFPFMHLGVLPSQDQVNFARGANGRAYGSAEHPIAMGAALVILIPPAIYLLQRSTRRRLHQLQVLVLIIGSLASVSRTPVLMLLTLGIFSLILAPRATIRRVPLLVPGLVLVHFMLPTTLGTIKSSFFPKGGLVAEQQSSKGTRGQGRVADIGPALTAWSKHPVFGEGLATRRVEPSNNDPLSILDDQWLGTLLSTGFAGVIGWLWLFGRFIRRSIRVGRLTDDPRSNLMLALAASVLAFAVGMLTLDSFAFVQLQLVLFVLMGLGMSALLVDPDAADSLAPIVELRQAEA